MTPQHRIFSFDSFLQSTVKLRQIVQKTSLLNIQYTFPHHVIKETTTTKKKRKYGVNEEVIID